MVDTTIIVGIIGGVAAIVTGSFAVFNNRKANRDKLVAETEELKARTQSEFITSLVQSQNMLKEMMQPLEEKIKNLEDELEKMKPWLCKKVNCPNRKVD